MKSPFYLEEISSVTNSYELKSFRIQYNEEQLLKYLVKFARKHTEQSLNKIYLVRNSKTKTIVAWFGLKSATLPFNDKGNLFLIPAIEMTHFAVDERFKSPENEKRPIKTGEFIFWNYILPIVQNVSEAVGCKNLFLFSINTPKLINYYKTKLGFKEFLNLDDKDFFDYAISDYDSDCKFLYMPITNEKD